MSKAKVALIGAGGTISSVGKGPFDLVDYSANGQMLDAAGLIGRFPEAGGLVDVIPVPFEAVSSARMNFPAWRALLLTCDRLVAEHPDLAGIVVPHGTASLEETAYFLHLTSKVAVPIVLVGAQRPPTALSSDAGMNLANALRTAASPAARGLGVLVLLNDEIHCAREVTKTSVFRLQTFRTPDYGVLGHADADAVVFYRQPLRRRSPDTEFDARGLDSLPRVDIAYAYAGADGTAARAFVAAGARGIVHAAFAPGLAPPEEEEALVEAVKAGVIVVQSTRVGSGRVVKTARQRRNGFLAADNLNPQKARLLLALALTRSSDPREIERIFQTY